MKRKEERGRAALTKCIDQTPTTPNVTLAARSKTQFLVPRMEVLFPRRRRVAYDPRMETRTEATMIPGSKVSGMGVER